MRELLTSASGSSLGPRAGLGRASSVRTDDHYMSQNSNNQRRRSVIGYIDRIRSDFTHGTTYIGLLVPLLTGSKALTTHYGPPRCRASRHNCSRLASTLLVMAASMGDSATRWALSSRPFSRLMGLRRPRCAQCTSPPQMKMVTPSSIRRRPHERTARGGAGSEAVATSTDAQRHSAEVAEARRERPHQGPKTPLTCPNRKEKRSRCCYFFLFWVRMSLF